MPPLISQVSRDSELENTLETDLKCNGVVTGIIMSFRAVCIFSPKSHQTAEQLRDPSMNKHFVSSGVTDHNLFSHLFLQLCF